MEAIGVVQLVYTNVGMELGHRHFSSGNVLWAELHVCHLKCSNLWRQAQERFKKEAWF